MLCITEMDLAGFKNLIVISEVFIASDGKGDFLISLVAREKMETSKHRLKPSGALNFLFLLLAEKKKIILNIYRFYNIGFGMLMNEAIFKPFSSCFCFFQLGLFI